MEAALRLGVGDPWGGQRGGRKEHTAPICIPNVASSLYLVPPELIGDLGPLTNVTATLHSPLSLYCEATGIPPPGIRWFRGEEPISPGENTYLLAGKVRNSASASVHHVPVISDPALPSMVGIIVSAISLPRVHPKTLVR